MSNIYYQNKDLTLYLDDSFKLLTELPSKSIDMVFADPPYFLSSGGISCNSGKQVIVDKGEWDKTINVEEKLNYNRLWLRLIRNVLKDDGTIWVSGTFYNIFDIKKFMDEIGYKVINVVIWHKTDPPPLIYKNKLRFSYELLIWASKGNKHKFNYEEMYKISNSELEDIWTIPAVKMNEKKFGYHPTQKPEALLERIILATTNPRDLVLDPFSGSGTTCFVAKKLKRNYIGIEQDKNYFNISIKRLNSLDIP